MKVSNGFTAEVSKAKESEELWQFQPHQSESTSLQDKSWGVKPTISRALHLIAKWPSAINNF